VRDFKALTAAAAAALAALVVCWTSAVVIGRRRIPRIRQCGTIEALAAEPIGQGGRLGRATSRPLCVRKHCCSPYHFPASKLTFLPILY